VEVFPVRISLYRFDYREERGRTEALARIQQDVLKTIPGARVTRASWVHGKKIQEKKERASLIIHLAIKEDQEKAVLKGILLKGVVYRAHLYSTRLQIL